jgi:hypothetical protein
MLGGEQAGVDKRLARARSALADLRASRSYGLVLLLIVVSFVFTTAAPDAAWARAVLLLIEGVTLIVALWTSRVGPLRVRVALAVLASCVAVVVLVEREKPVTATVTLLDGLTVTAVAVVIVRGVIGERTVNAQSVLGAICIYLQVGMFFMFVYGVDAALGSGPLFAQGTDGTPALRLYFSFVTLATLGYGDYTTAGNLGHALSVSEALLGQLYLVTVVAVLVGRLGRRRPADETDRASGETSG